MWVKSWATFENMSLQTLISFFKQKDFVPSDEQKGYTFFAEGYIHDLWTNVEETNKTVKTKCFPLHKKKTVTTHFIMFDNGDNVLDANCSCEAG
jgi:hypothetical protein